MNDPHSRAQVRLHKHVHEFLRYAQEELVALSGHYVPDAVDKMRQFWRERGLHVELEEADMGHGMHIRHARCLEDVS